MEPLAISSLVLQTPSCRLDLVLLTLGNLYRIYSQPHVNEDISTTVLASLEMRWKRADQEVFILAVLFNPFIRDAAFSDAHLTRSSLLRMCMRAHTRFFRRRATPEFWDACKRYLERKERFSDDEFALNIHRQRVHDKVCDFDLLSIWRDIESERTHTAQAAADQDVVRLAILLLSVIATSMACERTFSAFGMIHSKRRNRLDVESTHDINLVRMDIRARHIDAGLASRRLKRRHGDEAGGSSSSIASTASSQTSQDDERLAADARDLIGSNSANDPTNLDELDELQHTEVPDPEDEVYVHQYPEDFGSYRKITLQTLFIYPPPGTQPAADSPLLFYWNGAVKELDEDEEVHAAAQGINS